MRVTRRCPLLAADGAHVYYAEPDADERFHIYRVAATGGAAENVSPVSWDFKEPLSRVTIKTNAAGAGANAPARLVVTDGDGHPLLPEKGLARFDGQNGQVYFYTPGAITIEVPAGDLKVQATRGFGAAAVTASKKIRAGEAAEITIDLPAPLWIARTRRLVFG